MNNRLLFLLAIMGIFSMQTTHSMFNKNAVSVEEAHAKAQEWVKKFEAQKQDRTEKTLCKTADLPDDVRLHIAKYYATRAWRNKFYHVAGSYCLPVCDKNHSIWELAGNGSQVVVKLHIEHNVKDINLKTNILQLWDFEAAQYLQEIAHLKKEPKKICMQELRAIAMSEQFIVYFKLEVSLDGGSQLIVHEKSTGKKVSLPGLNELDEAIEFVLCAISPDEQYIVCVSNLNDHRFFVFQRQTDGSWKAAWNKVHSMAEFHNRLEDITFSADSRLLITLSMDNSIKIWDLATGELKKTLTTEHSRQPLLGTEAVGALRNCVTNADGTIIAATRLAYAKPIIWHIDSREGLAKELIIEKQYKFKFSDDIWATYFDSNGQLVSEHDDGKLQAWDPQTGAPTDTVLGTKQFDRPDHSSLVTTENGCYLVSGRNQAITVKMTIASMNKLLRELTLEQLMLIDSLMFVRHKQVQKDQTKALELPKDQLAVFMTLPPFVQTALRLNLNLAIPGMKQASAGAESKSHVETKKLAHECKEEKKS